MLPIATEVLILLAIKVLLTHTPPEPRLDLLCGFVLGLSLRATSVFLSYFPVALPDGRLEWLTSISRHLAALVTQQGY